MTRPEYFLDCLMELWLNGCLALFLRLLCRILGGIYFSEARKKRRKYFHQKTKTQYFQFNILCSKFYWKSSCEFMPKNQLHNIWAIELESILTFRPNVFSNPRNSWCYKEIECCWINLEEPKKKIRDIKKNLLQFQH